MMMILDIMCVYIILLIFVFNRLAKFDESYPPWVYYGTVAKLFLLDLFLKTIVFIEEIKAMSINCSILCL